MDCATPCYRRAPHLAIEARRLVARAECPSRAALRWAPVMRLPRTAAPPLVVQCREGQFRLGHGGTCGQEHLYFCRRLRLPGEPSCLLDRGLCCGSRHLKLVPRFVSITCRLQHLCHMVLCDRVLWLQGGNCRGSLTVMFENLGQLRREGCCLGSTHPDGSQAGRVAV